MNPISSSFPSTSSMYWSASPDLSQHPSLSEGESQEAIDVKPSLIDMGSTIQQPHLSGNAAIVYHLFLREISRTIDLIDMGIDVIEKGANITPFFQKAYPGGIRILRMSPFNSVARFIQQGGSIKAPDIPIPVGAGLGAGPSGDEMEMLLIEKWSNLLVAVHATNERTILDALLDDIFDSCLIFYQTLVNKIIVLMLCHGNTGESIVSMAQSYAGHHGGVRDTCLALQSQVDMLNEEQRQLLVTMFKTSPDNISVLSRYVESTDVMYEQISTIQSMIPNDNRHPSLQWVIQNHLKKAKEMVDHRDFLITLMKKCQNDKEWGKKVHPDDRCGKPQLPDKLWKKIIELI